MSLKLAFSIAVYELINQNTLYITSTRALRPSFAFNISLYMNFKYFTVANILPNFMKIRQAIVFLRSLGNFGLVLHVQVTVG
jgi:hypothetical protein